MTIEQISQVVHEIQKAFCESVGDHSLPAWDDAPAMQASTIEGVLYLLDNPSATFGSCHEEWCNSKIADGWVYGHDKDWNAKTHPCLIPFSELSLIDQQKDVLFVQTVRSLEKFIS